MRRILGFLLTLFISFQIVITVQAEEIKCEYEDVGLTMTWDTEKEFDVSSNPFVDMQGYDSDQDYERQWLLWRSGKKVKLTEQAEIDQKLYDEVLGNYGCNDKMKVCVYLEIASDTLLSVPTDLLDALFAWDWDKVDLGGNKQTLLIMTEKEYRDSKYAKYEDGGFYVFGHDQVEERWDDGYNFGDVVGSLGDYLAGIVGVGEEHHTYVYKETDCTTVNYDGPYIGVNINCSLLSNKILSMVKQIDEYKSCGDDFPCKSQKKLRVNEIEEGIKKQCRTYLENYNYSGGEKECIDACLNIKDTLNSYKEGTDLYDDGTDNSACGFSGRLITWIINILRWLKYILPVFVIVLGILDFIKAISSDKDDEMKKAQKRFIIRLISAALVFLIPLIIEFVLIKMGFDYNDCGLFK